MAKSERYKGSASVKKKARVEFGYFGGFRTPDTREFASLPGYATAEDVLRMVAREIGFPVEELRMCYQQEQGILTADDGLAKIVKPNSVLVVSLKQEAGSSVQA